MAPQKDVNGVKDVQDVTDDLLIRRFGNGDEAAFVALYRRHSPPVYGLLCRLLGPRRPDANDLLQEAWIRAATRLSSFRGDAQFRTWLTAIAINCYREWRRRHLRDHVGEAVDANLDVNGPNDQDEDIRRVLAGMPDAFREILVLHDVEGYTHDEIAHLIGIEPGTSKSRLSRARQLFRRRWAPPVGERHD